MPLKNNLRLDDGFATFVEMDLAPTLKIWEKEITPPGMMNGGPIDTTTMRNTAFRTAAPKQLKTATTIKATCAYATSALAELQSVLGLIQFMTVRLPDGSSYGFYGWLDEFQPANLTEGTQPTASVTFIPSLRHPETGEEVAPVYTPPVDNTID